MITWQQKKKEMKSIPDTEVAVIDSLAYLQATRIKKGISQAELAKRIGMKQAQLAKIESLDSIPSLETLTRYAKGLGLTTKLIFTPESNKTFD